LLQAGKATMCAARELMDQKINETRSYARDKATAIRELAGMTCEGLRSKGLKNCIGDSTCNATGQAFSTATSLASAATDPCTSARRQMVECAMGVADTAKARASELGASACGLAGDQRVQVSAASAASGAIALGASGGATGLAVGGALGAALGLVPAVFTFGLSIPISAAMGGGAGLLVGTTVGGTVGAVGGGAAGYSLYSRKDDIGMCAVYVKAKAAEASELVRGKSTAAYDCAVQAADFTKAQAYASAEYVAEKASAAKSRLVGCQSSGTGGTETSDGDGEV